MKARAEAPAAWFGAMTATALGAAGMPIEIFGGRNVPGIPLWPAIASMVVSTALFVILFVRRHRPNAQLAAVFFVVNAAALGFAFFMRDPHYAELSNWMPFQASKLACIVAALLAPRLWAAFAGIGIHALGSILVLWTVAPSVRQHIVFEPMGIIGFALVGGVLAFHRLRRLALEREVAIARAEKLGAERLARTLVAVRDLANTPIQTIEMCHEILRVGGSEAHPEASARLQRAIERLRKLSLLLARYEDGMTFRAEDTSIEATALLELGAPTLEPGGGDALHPPAAR
jgi:hypothetical protein